MVFSRGSLLTLRSQLVLGQIKLFFNSTLIPLCQMFHRYASYIRQFEYKRIAGIVLVFLLLSQLGTFLSVLPTTLVAGADPADTTTVGSLLLIPTCQSIGVYSEFSGDEYVSLM